MVNTVLLILLIGLIVYGVARNPRFFSRLYHRALWSEKSKVHKADEMVMAIQDDDGNRPLHVAASMNHPGIVTELLSQKCDANARDELGNTVLNKACVIGDLGICRALLEAGANPALADNFGFGPLHSAARMGHVELVRLLNEQGADVNAAGLTGQTPLIAAAWEGQLETTRLLVELGADLTLKDNGNRTAPGVARSFGHVDIVAYFNSLR